MRAFNRRTVSAALVSALAAPRAAAEPPRVVTLLGDSILAGYGLPAELGPAPELQAELLRLGVDIAVRNAGLPGDTSAGGVGRLKMAIRRDTAVCVVEFGGNDRRAGYPPWMTRDSLNEIMTRLKAERVSPILLGLKLAETTPDALAFNAVFATVAAKHGAPLIDDYLADVTRQEDGVHPDAAGARSLAARLAPYVVDALKSRG